MSESLPEQKRRFLPFLEPVASGYLSRTLQLEEAGFTAHGPIWSEALEIFGIGLARRDEYLEYARSEVLKTLTGYWLTETGQQERKSLLENPNSGIYGSRIAVDIRTLRERDRSSYAQMRGELQRAVLDLRHAESASWQDQVDLENIIRSKRTLIAYLDSVVAESTEAGEWNKPVNDSGLRKYSQLLDAGWSIEVLFDQTKLLQKVPVKAATGRLTMGECDWVVQIRNSRDELMLIASIGKLLPVQNDFAFNVYMHGYDTVADIAYCAWAQWQCLSKVLPELVACANKGLPQQ